MSLTEFATVIGTLAVATGRTMDDETISVYFAALRDLPSDTFKAGVGRMLKSVKFFPSVGEIRASCDRVRAGKGFATFTLPALPSAGMDETDPRLWYACLTCQDSGWAPHWCPGTINASPKDSPAQPFVSVGSCGSRSCAQFGQSGYGHEFMRRCVCYATNPKIRERLDARRKYSEAE